METEAGELQMSKVVEKSHKSRSFYPVNVERMLQKVFQQEAELKV